jgi:hypothetical protein
MQQNISAAAHELRRWPVVHRVARWLRRTLARAIVEGFWEFARMVFAQCPRFGPPHRLFSVYQALRNQWPKLNGRIVLHDQGNPIVREGSLLAMGTTTQHDEQPWPIVWSEHAPARLVTRSLALLGEGKQLCLESVYGHARWRDDPAARYLRLPPPVRLSGPWTSVVSRWVPNTGVPNHSHWLFDALPRLAVLGEFPPDTQMLVPSRLAAYQQESLAMMGLLERCRPTPERHLELERYYFSAPTSMIVCHNPYAVDFLRRTFLPKADPNYAPPKRLLLLRVGKGRVPVNSDEVNAFFEKRGWTLANPEALTFAQEIKLFAEAEAIVSMSGSGLTNIVFCRPECAVVQMAYDYWMDGVNDWIAQVVKLRNYSSLVFPCDYSQRIYIDLKRLEAHLASVGLV